MFGPKFPVPQQTPAKPLLVPSNPPPLTLRDVMINQPTTGLLGGKYHNSLLNALANPQPKPKPDTSALLDILLRSKGLLK